MHHFIVFSMSDRIELDKELNNLNKLFYSITAKHFDQTRQYPWDGWAEVVNFIKTLEDVTILDIGCGNGRFLTYLLDREVDFVDYLGTDSSEELLEFVPEGYSFEHSDIHNIEVNKGYSVAVLFGVIHHLPPKVFEKLTDKLYGAGVQNIVLTTWNFHTNDKLMSKSSEAKEVIKNYNFMDSSDHILDWVLPNGDSAYRYCRTWTEEALNSSTTGKYKIINKFDSDGRNKKLNTYYTLSIIV